MALLGQAALAMWWDMAPEQRTEFQDWHSHEHFRERLAIPGFRRATRWSAADGGEGFAHTHALLRLDRGGQNLAHLRFRTTAVLGRPHAQSAMHVIRHIPYGQDCHTSNPLVCLL